MREAAEVLLRRRGQGDGLNAGGQGGDNVHDDRGRVDRQAAGDVEPHARHRHPVLADDGAVAEFDVDVRRALAVGEPARAADGFFQGGPHCGVQVRPVPRAAPRRGRAGCSCSTPSNVFASSLSAAKPRVRTAVMMSVTFCSASAMVWCCARGTAARRPARESRWPRKSMVRKLMAGGGGLCGAVRGNGHQSILRAAGSALFSVKSGRVRLRRPAPPDRRASCPVPAACPGG